MSDEMKTSMSQEDANQMLIEASRNGNIKNMKIALANKANPSIHFRQTLQEITPLILCATKGYHECVELLLDKDKYNVDVNEQMAFSHATALFLAVSNENVKCVELLLQNGSIPTKVDKLGRTPLMDAAETGNLEIVTKIVKKLLEIHNSPDKPDKYILDQPDSESKTALSYALDFVEKKDQKWYEVCKYLVDNNADCTVTGRSTNRTLLHCAAALGKFDDVKFLVEEKKVNILEYDTSQFTPIMYANKANEVAIAEYLTQKANSGCCVIL